MTVCVQADASGVLTVMVPQPADTSTCAYVLQSGPEVKANPFALSVEDGTQVGWGIVAVWVAAWVGRMLIKALSNGDEVQAE